MQNSVFAWMQIFMRCYLKTEQLRVGPSGRVVTPSGRVVTPSGRVVTLCISNRSCNCVQITERLEDTLRQYDSRALSGVDRYN